MKRVFVLLIAMLCLAGFAMASEAPDVSRAGPLNFSAGFGPLLAVPGVVIDLAPPAYDARDLVFKTASATIKSLLDGRAVTIPYRNAAPTSITRRDRCTQLASSIHPPTINLRRFATTYDTRARPASYPRRT